MAVPRRSGSSGGGEITVAGCTPQNPFVPANTNETCGGDVLDAVLAKLVRYNPDTAAPENDIAESIETTDNQNFTVKIKKGYKFQDGTEVKAKNFVDAWNWDRYGPNGTLNSYFFDPIKGSSDLDCGANKAGEQDCTANPPAAKTMSGLEGRRRLHLHHRDHREGLEPSRAARLHRLRAAARQLLR